MRTEFVLIVTGCLFLVTSCYGKDHPDAARYTNADRAALARLVSMHAPHVVTARAKLLREVPDIIEQAVQANCEERMQK
jgi:hypothetical protein